MTDRSLFGWRVRSALAIDELQPWTGDADRAPDITIEIGAVPERLADATQSGPFLQVAAGGLCQLGIADVARYRVEGGRRVTIQPIAAADAPDIRTFLLGSVIGLLCHQRGMLPLHASAVRIGDRAVAFAGFSGGGKSTLAATLAQRGHTLLADDVAAIDADAPGGPLLWPGLPRLKLWRDSLDRLGIDSDPLPRARRTLDKFQLVPPRFDAAPIRLSAVYGLVTARGPMRPGIEPVAGRAAVALLSSNVYRPTFARLIGRQAAQFGAVMRIAQATPIHSLVRPDDLARTDELAAMVEGHVAALAR